MSAAEISSTLLNIDAFRRTFEARSFTRAARALGVTPQATSRAVARLEVALGVTLFRRTTRSLAPTEEGARYYDACSRALSLLAEAERELPARRASPAGLVRISAPTTYGHHRLIPSLGAFRERHPAVRVELHVGNQNVDFVRDGHDLAIRMGEPADQTLVARRLGDFALGVYGSPGYLARRGTPRTPADLAGHHCITFLLPRTGRPLPWIFHPSPRSLMPASGWICSEDVLATIGLARAGVGLVQTYAFLVDDDVARGALVPVLATHAGASRPFHVLHPKGVTLSAGARALKEFVLEREAASRAGSRR